MPMRVGPQLGRVVILPFATIGVIAAVLVWAVEHAPSLLLLISIVIGSITIGVVVARQVRANIETLAGRYESMLQLAAVTVDPDRLQQVVWNLVSNAIKFTHANGHVDVAARVQDGELVITVDDNGIGFRPEVAMHLFERFRQGDSSTTRAYGGLGLGLGIVRYVVELHGGTVTASSAGENTGSLFEVRIPVNPANAPAVEAPFPQPQLPSLRGVSVLVVDDDPQAIGAPCSSSTMTRTHARCCASR